MRKIQVYGQIRLEQRIGFFSKQTTLKSKTHVLVQYPIFKDTMHNNCRCFQSTANHNQRHNVKGRVIFALCSLCPSALANNFASS